MFMQLFRPILYENVSVDSQVNTLSQFSVKMQYVVYIVTIMFVILCVCLIVIDCADERMLLLKTQWASPSC